MNKLQIKWHLYTSKPMPDRGPISKVFHVCLVRLFWPFYRRAPEYLQGYGPWKAYKLLCDNLNHLRDVELPSARKIEGMALKEAMEERRLRVHAESRLLGLDEGTMEHINSVFGTDLPTKQMD